MLSATPNRRISTFGFRTFFGVCTAIAAGCQSATLPSIMIGNVGPAEFPAPRSGARRRATERSGMT